MQRFRTVYVVEPSKHDLSLLYEHCENMKFLSTGYEVYSKLLEAIENNLIDFDPNRDAILPIGRVVSTFLVGIALANIQAEGNIMMGIFKGQEYEFIPVTLDGLAHD